MHAIAAIRTIIETANRILLEVTSDLTVDQTNWLPPGTANSIGQTYAHIVNVQDRYLNSFILAQPTIWEREGWGNRLGLPDTMRMSREAAAEERIDPAAFRAYAERVFGDTRDYLAGIDDTEIAREVQGYHGPVSVGDVLSRLMAFHASSHLGEISAIKGVQGMKGLPF